MRYNILIVEDDEKNVLLLNLYFEKSIYQLICISNGLEALQIQKEFFIKVGVKTVMSD